LVWKGDLLTDWGATRPQWAVSTSPLLYGDWVIMAPWGKKAAVVAYEKATGKVVWTTPNPRGVELEYQSPVSMTVGGRDIILATGRKGYLIGVDARTGKELFSYDGFVTPASSCWNIPSPVVVGEGRVFMTGGYGEGCVMLKIGPAGDRFKVTQLWKNQNMGSKCAQALPWNGFIYGNSADVGGGLRCLSPEGQIRWDSKAASQRSFDLGNLIIADGLIYIIDGGNGDLYMAEATPDAYRQLGRASFLRPPEPWAPPAFKDGKLVIRDMHKMFCLDVAAAK
jgi:outer membrane protein assembly factor BamB